MVPKRLGRLEELSWAGGPRVFVARSFRARLLGLAFLTDLPRDCGLLIPRCSTVHTFGMRFPLDLVFLDARGCPLRIVREVGPWRVVWRPGAAAVLERAAREERRPIADRPSTGPPLKPCPPAC